MKKVQEPKSYTIKTLRGIIGEDGQPVKKGAVITCNRNLAKILISTGRGEIADAPVKA